MLADGMFMLYDYCDNPRYRAYKVEEGQAVMMMQYLPSHFDSSIVTMLGLVCERYLVVREEIQESQKKTEGKGVHHVPLISTSPFSFFEIGNENSRLMTIDLAGLL